MAQLMYARGIQESLYTAPKAVPAWVRQVLEPDQLSTAKHGYGRAKLTGGTMLLLWGLRVYVLLMTVLIGVQIWNVMHTPAGG